MPIVMMTEVSDDVPIEGASSEDIGRGESDVQGGEGE